MNGVSRRDAIKLIAAAGAAAGCESASPRLKTPNRKPAQTTARDAVVAVRPLGFQWQTSDPFLFCVHHDDRYPRGNSEFGPATSLAGRNLGQDFQVKDGFRMYHGRVVPGFPRHPHRGFETVTVVRRGLLDHSDSLGAAARYGGGDVQWLTAGSGIQHAEMFPLLKSDAENPLELFQIWLNLPRASKMVPAHFSMLWSERIPTQSHEDADGRKTNVTVIAGRYEQAVAPSPPPNSWAHDPSHHVAIWTIRMEPGAKWTLPRAPNTHRSLYFFMGSSLRVAGREVPGDRQIELDPDVDVALQNGPDAAEMLLLQGRPIAEPIARHGPFVMNTENEIRQAYADYRRTEFGGWPWNGNDPVHGAKPERFARRPNGDVERPT